MGGAGREAGVVSKMLTIEAKHEMLAQNTEKRMLDYPCCGDDAGHSLAQLPNRAKTSVRFENACNLHRAHGPTRHTERPAVQRHERLTCHRSHTHLSVASGLVTANAVKNDTPADTPALTHHMDPPERSKNLPPLILISHLPGSPAISAPCLPVMH